MNNIVLAPKATDNRSLYEESWDLLGEVIRFHDAGNKPDPGLEKEADDYFRMADKRHIHAIGVHFQKAHRRRLIRHAVPNVLRLIVMLVGVLALAVGAAYAASPQVRRYVANLIIETTPEYTLIQVQSPADAATAPAGWGGAWYPSVIPEGLTLASIDSDGNSCLAAYRGPGSDGLSFIFTEIISGNIKLDTEDAECQTVMIRGHEGQAVLKNDLVTVYWSANDRLLILTMRNATIDQAVDCAEAVLPVDR